MTNYYIVMLAQKLSENRVNWGRSRTRLWFRRTSGSGLEKIYILSHFQNGMNHLCRSNNELRSSNSKFVFELFQISNFPPETGHCDQLADRIPVFLPDLKTRVKVGIIKWSPFPWCSQYSLCANLKFQVLARISIPRCGRNFLTSENVFII